MKTIILFYLLTVSAFALSPAEKAELQTRVDAYLAGGTNDSHTIYRDLTNRRVLSNRVTIVSINRDELELKMRQFLKSRAQQVGITLSDTLAQADAKWDAFVTAAVTAAPTTAQKLSATYSGASDKALWFSFYTQLRSNQPDDSPTVTQTNSTPVLSQPKWTNSTPVVVGDIEDCYPKPPPAVNE